MKRNRRLLISSQFFSETGDWIAATAVMLQVYQMTHSAIWVSFILISENIAVMMSSTIGGVIADRFEPKKCMIVTDIMRALLVCLVPFVSFHVVSIYAILMMMVFCTLIFLPGKMKLIRRISTDEEVASLNSLSYSITGGVKIIGYLIGGIVVGSFGYRLPYFLDAFTFVLSALLLSFIRSTWSNEESLVQTVQEKKSIAREFLESITEFRTYSMIPKLIMIFMFGSFVVGVFVPQLVVFNSQVLRGDDLIFSYLNCAVAVGMLVASMGFTKIVMRFHPITAIIVSRIGLGVTLICLAVSTYPHVLIILFVLGLFQPVPSMVGMTLITTVIPERLLGKFVGILNVFTTSLYLSGMLVGGLVASQSVTEMYVGCGGLTLAFTMLLYLNRHKFRRDMQYTHLQQQAKSNV